MGAVCAVSAAQVLMLLSCLAATSAAPLTDREKQNRIVAVSKSEASLLSAAVSQASPGLLRVALTSAEPKLLETALTKSNPELLVAALNNVDPDLLKIALTKSEQELLETALTAAKVELLRTALNAPTNAAILEVALTLSSPELLAVALQDASVENLIVALTAADGSLGKSSDFTQSLKFPPQDALSLKLENLDKFAEEESYGFATGGNDSNEESDESKESDESEESSESEESDESRESDESGESEESVQPTDIDFSQPPEEQTSQSLAVTNPVEDFDAFPAVPSQPFSKASGDLEQISESAGAISKDSSTLQRAIPSSEDSEAPYGALSPSVQTRLSTFNTQSPQEAYGALSPSVQSRLSNVNAKPSEESFVDQSSVFQATSRTADTRLSSSVTVHLPQSSSLSVEHAGVLSSQARVAAPASSPLLSSPSAAPSPVDAFPFFIPGGNPSMWLTPAGYNRF